MEKFKIQEKGELKIINLDQVTYITVHEKTIHFYFVTGKLLSFNEIQLGADEFMRIKDRLVCKNVA